MRKIFLSSILFLSSSSVSAVTLEEALISGYTHNEDLKIARNKFSNDIEAFPRALAGFMPKISANINSSDQKIKKRSGITDINTYSKSLTLDQPIFDGWSSVAGLKAAQFGFHSARGDFYENEQEVFVKEINTYLSCFEAKEKHEISKISIKSNKAQLEAMQEKFKLGESTATEVASAKEALAAAESNAATSYAQYEQAKASFYQIFGIEANNVEMPPLPADLPLTLPELIEKSIATNPSIYSANYRRKSSKALESASKGKLLPRAGVRVEHGRTKYNTDMPNYKNNKSITTTLSLTVPILERGGMEYSDVRRSKLETKKAIIDFDSAIKKLKANCQSKWAELNSSKVRIRATEERVRAAEIAYEGMIQEEILGSRTIIEVLQAEEKLHKARESRIEAKKAMILVAYQVKSLLGELTSKGMKLNVDHFNLENEFKRIKMKIIGF